MEYAKLKPDLALSIYTDLLLPLFLPFVHRRFATLRVRYFALPPLAHHILPRPVEMVGETSRVVSKGVAIQVERGGVAIERAP